MRGYEAIAEALSDCGVERVFGLMGEGNLDLIAYMSSNCGIRYYGARHEAGGVLMADGYSRVTGRVGVCTVTQGPGFTNALTALTAAARNGSRLLLIAADTPAGESSHPQFVDQAVIAGVLGVDVQIVGGAGTAAEDVAVALETVHRGQRPVLLRAPADRQRADGGRRLARAARLEESSPLTVDAAGIARVADLVSGSRRPVILAGRGAHAAGARADLDRLGERIGALMATSLLAKGLFSGNPFHIGVLGGYASNLAVDLIQQADCVLAFGASLNTWQTRAGALLSGVRVVQFDREQNALGRWAPVQIGIAADAGLAAQALNAELARRGFSSAGFRNPGVESRIAAYSRDSEFTDESRDGQIDPRTLTLQLDSVLPRERTVVVDGGHFTGYPCMYMSVPDPDGFIYAIDFGATGLGLGTALGAAIGRPNRTTVLMIGDGGLLMTLPELDTAVRYRVPALIFVMNDMAYGSEVHHLRLRGLPDRQAIFETPSLSRIARAVGAGGMDLRGSGDLELLRKRLAGGLAGPLLVDAHINGDIMADWFRSFATHAAATGRWT